MTIRQINIQTNVETTIPDNRVVSEEEVVNGIRDERDALLAASDTMALADRITDEWRTYRQALRDVPAQAGFPNSVTWPTEPS